MIINRKILYRLSIEAGKEITIGKITDRILNLFLPKDYDTWAVILPLRLGWEIYEEIYAAFFHQYELVPEFVDTIEEWFLFDQELEPLQAEWHDIRYYADPQTQRKYPPMILRDVTKEVPKWAANGEPERQEHEQDLGRGKNQLPGTERQ